MGASNWTVDIKDFQSLKDVHIDIVPGLNIIVGKSNSGKSAVFRGIDASIFNMGDDSMIRSGNRYYGISISNGQHKMVFMRDGKGKNEKTAYQFDGGTVQKKVGRTQLPEVAKMFNVRDVRMNNGSKMKINFWYQNDRPFLMDKTPGQLYEFLSLSSSDRYSRVLKIMQSDCKTLDAEVNNITTEIDTLKTVNNKKQDFLDANDGYDAVYYDVVTLSQKKNKIDAVEKLTYDIDSIKSRMIALRDRVLETEKRLNLVLAEDFEGSYNRFSQSCRDYSSVEKYVEDVENCSRQVDLVSSNISRIDDRILRIEPDITVFGTDIDRIQSLSKSVFDVDSIVSQYVSIQNSVDSVSKEISSIDLDRFLDLDGIQENIKEVSSRMDSFNFVGTMISGIRSLERSLDLVDGKIQDNTERLRESDKELEEFKDSVGFCPFCGTVFDKKVGHTH